MVEELIKNEVEKSLGDGKRVTGISKVVDLDFLRELEILVLTKKKSTQKSK